MSGRVYALLVILALVILVVSVVYKSLWLSLLAAALVAYLSYREKRLQR
jgi:hypothetical protein